MLFKLENTFEEAQKPERNSWPDGGHVIFTAFEFHVKYKRVLRKHGN